MPGESDLAENIDQYFRTVQIGNLQVYLVIAGGELKLFLSGEFGVAGNGRQPGKLADMLTSPVD